MSLLVDPVVVTKTGKKKQQVLCALTSSVKGVPSKTPKKKLAAKWRQKASGTPCLAPVAGRMSAIVMRCGLGVGVEQEEKKRRNTHNII